MLALPLVTGCPDDSPPPAGSGEGSTSAAGGTTGLSESPQTTAGSSSSGNAEGSGTTQATLDGGSSDDTTGTPGTICESTCENLAKCKDAPFAGCVLECEEYFEQIAGFEDCEQAALDLYACFGQAECDEIYGGCQPEIDAEFLACEEGLGCTQFVSGANDGSNCLIEQTCGDGLERYLECEAGTCTCFDQGMDVGTCPQQELCLDLADAQFPESQALVDDFLMECCGWKPPVAPIDQ
ncbi:MAG: hypothetical protein AAF799_13170 [Myxococcota bacterium]